MTRDIIWTGKDLQDALGVCVAKDMKVTGAETDSRAVLPGDMFFALKGQLSDGHKHVAQAFDNGASAAIVQSLPEGVAQNDSRLIWVNDVFDALNTLAHAARARFSGKVVGITGSAGKTSTKEALARALARTAKTHKSAKSYNNHVGLPLTLVRMPANAAFAVIEMGMSSAGEIRALSQMARPHLAIVTSVGAAHHENFASIDDIARAKAEIFEGLEAGGIALINMDGPYAGILEQAAKACGADVKNVSLSADEVVFANAIRQVAHEHCTCLVADVAGLRLAYKVGLPGQHWAANSLLVLAAVHIMGGDIGLAGLELADLHDLDGRGARTRVVTQHGGFWVVDESYNANPLSMAAALEVLGLTRPSKKYGERIAILADMLELGVESERAHLSLVEKIKDAGVDRVLTIGPMMNAVRQAHLTHLPGIAAETVDDVIKAMKRVIKPGDIVLVKGSNAFGLNRVVESLKGLHEDGPSLWVDVAGAAE